jgi:hypothetical protein
MSRPFFTPADWPFVCAECGEHKPINSLLMYQATREPYMYRMVTRRRPLCEDCGRALLETEEPK